MLIWDVTCCCDYKLAHIKALTPWLRRTQDRPSETKKELEIRVALAGPLELEEEFIKVCNLCRKALHNRILINTIQHPLIQMHGFMRPLAGARIVRDHDNGFAHILV